MARITLSRDEYTSGELPPVCVVCGEYSERTQWHNFHTTPMAIVLWGFTAPWACFIVPMVLTFLAMLASINVALSLPVCPDHCNHWRIRFYLTWAIALSTWANLGLAMCFPGHHVNVIGLYGSWILASIALFVLPRTEVHVSRIDEEALTLSGVHPDFVAAVENARHTKPRGDADCG